MSIYSALSILTNALMGSHNCPGVMDISVYDSPLIIKTPINGLYPNGDSCDGVFEAVSNSGQCFISARNVRKMNFLIATQIGVNVQETN
jgi:hypothetical protein